MGVFVVGEGYWVGGSFTLVRVGRCVSSGGGAILPKLAAAEGPVIAGGLSRVITRRLREVVHRRRVERNRCLPSRHRLVTFFNIKEPSIERTLSSLERGKLVQCGGKRGTDIYHPSPRAVVGKLSNVIGSFLSATSNVGSFRELHVFFRAGLMECTTGGTAPRSVRELRGILDVRRGSLEAPRICTRCSVRFRDVLTSVPSGGMLGAVRSTFSR